MSTGRTVKTTQKHTHGYQADGYPAAEEEDYEVEEDEALCIRQLTIPASVNVALKTDYKKKDIGKYEDAALMPSMTELSTPTTSMNVPRIRQGRVFTRTPGRRRCIEEAELFERNWDHIKSDFILEEKFSKQNLSRLCRSLEIWQSAVEATIREKVASEAVLKLSPDCSPSPPLSPSLPSQEYNLSLSMFPDDEEEEEEEMPGKAIEYAEGPDSDDESEEDEDEPGEAEESAEEEEEDMPSTGGPPPGYDEDWDGPWTPKQDQEEEKMPEEAEEYLTSPEVAEEEEWNKYQRGDTGEHTPYDPKFLSSPFFLEMPEAPPTPVGPSSWQQNVEAAQQSLAHYHESIAPVPMDTSAGRSRASQRASSWSRGVGPHVDLKQDTFAPIVLTGRHRAYTVTTVGRKVIFAPSVQIGDNQEFKRAGSPMQQSRQKSRKVRFNAQEDSKKFTRGSPPSSVRRSQFLSKNSLAGVLSRSVLADVLRGRNSKEEVMSRGDIVPTTARTKRRQPTYSEEEEEVRALVWAQADGYPAAEEEDYEVEEDEALCIRQLEE
ncbi:hypothetical protein EI94DRAFT_1809646 [Lactarius quietus]|nr:hypothetical protein EI94DRAFT_1809646 [Lactarius quietus]